MSQHQLWKNKTKYRKNLFGKTKNPKIKHITFCNNYDNGVLKNVDIFSKIISLQCFWIIKLYDNTTPSWKVISLHLIKAKLGLNFKFHSNLDISVRKIKKFPTNYNTVLRNWYFHSTFSPVLPPAIASQALWYNKNIKIDSKSIYLSKISEKGLKCVRHLFNENQMLKSWDELKQQHSFHKNKIFLLVR